MAKRKKRASTAKSAPVWKQSYIGVIALVILTIVIMVLAAPSAGHSFITTAWEETSTPTPTPTATLTLTATPTSTATATSTSTTKPVPTATTDSPPPTLTPLPQLASPTTQATDTPSARATESGDIPVYSYRVINTYPHDPNAYVQGLVIEDGVFYEGTGRLGQSTLRRVEVETGTVLESINLPPQFFGEGITIFGDRIIQLTWHAGIGFVYDQESFELLQLLNYPTQGWGITHDGQRLIMSDGTATLYFWDPNTLEEIGRVEVLANGQPVTMLNELEYINGEIFANVWQTDFIARIEPDTGRVVGWINMTGLQAPEERGQERVAVLNGIAYDAENDRLFVTGKLWPKLYEIELIAPEKGRETSGPKHNPRGGE